MAFAKLADALPIAANRVRDFGPYLLAAADSLRGGITTGTADYSIDVVKASDGSQVDGGKGSLSSTLTTALNATGSFNYIRWVTIHVASGTAGTLTFDRGS